MFVLTGIVHWTSAALGQSLRFKLRMHALQLKLSTSNSVGMKQSDPLANLRDLFSTSIVHGPPQSIAGVVKSCHIEMERWRDDTFLVGARDRSPRSGIRSKEKYR
jgi:hypothetical protein